MAGPVPTGKRFVKGQSGNPKGAAAHNPEVKLIRKLTHADVAEIGALILTGDMPALLKIKDDPKTTPLKMWIAAVAIKGISRGDASALNALLDRIAGKVKDQVHHIISDGPDLANASTAKLQLIEKILADPSDPIEG